MNDFADLIITNAKVFTVDDQNPRAGAVAVKGNEIVYVGDDAGAVAWRGPKTRLVDGRQHSLLPGFIDSHFHLMHGAIALGDMQLYEVGTMAELQTAVHTFAAQNPNLPWLRGQGLRYSIPSIDEPLTRHHLDAIEAERLALDPVKAEVVEELCGGCRTCNALCPYNAITWHEDKNTSWMHVVLRENGDLLAVYIQNGAPGASQSAHALHLLSGEKPHLRGHGTQSLDNVVLPEQIRLVAGKVRPVFHWNKMKFSPATVALASCMARSGGSP